MPTTLEVNMDYKSVQRFPAWVSLTVFSAMCLAGLESEYPLTYDVTAAHKGSLACLIISIVLSFTGVLFYLLMRHLFIAKPLEIGMTGLLLVVWGAGFVFIMNPQRGIVGDYTYGYIFNENLYFGAWAALISIVYIGGSLAQEVTGVNVRNISPAQTGRWYALTATSIVLGSNAVQLLNAKSCHNPYLTHLEFCKGTKFSIATGVVSTLASLFMAYAVQSGLLGHLLEFGITTFLFVFWCFNVYLVMFGISQEALYYTSLISFLLIVIIFAQAFQSFILRIQNQDQGASTENQANCEVEPDIKEEDVEASSQGGIDQQVQAESEPLESTKIEASVDDK